MRPWSSASVSRISPTPRSSSALVTNRAHPLALDDPGDGYDLIATHDQGPPLTVRARDLGVDEHVLDLLRAAGEPVARPPPPHFKAWELGSDTPGPPADLAIEVDGALLEPD